MSAATRRIHQAQYATRGKKANSPAPFHGWKSELNAIIKEHNHFKGTGDRQRIASHRTCEERSLVLFRCFNELRVECGLKIDNPVNLKPKHIVALTKLWESNGLSAATIQGKMSILRTFCQWIGKPTLVRETKRYFENEATVTRHLAATHDKSWSAIGLDIHVVLEQVAAVDLYVAMQLLVIAIVGLRRKEGVMFNPFLSDEGLVLLLNRGTKGGRPRFTLIDDDQKRAVIEKAKDFVLKMKGTKGHIGAPGKTLKQNLKRYSNVLYRLGINKAELGVTGHGLRTQFICDRLEERGIVPPVRSKSGRQESSLSDEDQELAKRKVSEEVGHSRTDVLAAYGGRFIKVRPPKIAISEAPDETRPSVEGSSGDADSQD